MSCSDPVLTDLEVLLEVGEGTVGFGEIDIGLRNVRIRAPVSVKLVSDIDLDRAEMSTLLWSIWSIDSTQFFNISEGTTLPHTIMLSCSMPSRGRMTPVSMDNLAVQPVLLRSRKIVISLMYSQHSS